MVTDLDAGQLTFTGERAGTYFLSYDAAFGNAPLDQGTIRVDVKASPKRAADPIAMPDTLTVYGQAPGIVDVLANDLDPAGGLLVVQRAVGDRADQLDVAIVDGRWLRISATRPDLAPATQTVSYTISNGTSSAVRGRGGRSPSVRRRRTTPRSRSPTRSWCAPARSVAAPVLDNDVSPAGDRLTLLSDLSSTDTPGELAVVAPIDVTGDVGKAFVSGRVVRYVAPEKVEERDTYTVRYVAQNLEGKRADGTLKVTVVPADDPNDAPEPPTLEGRVVSGRHRQGPGARRWASTATATRSRSRASPPPRGSAGSSPSAATSSSTRPTRARSAPTSSPTPSSTPQGAFATGTVRVAVVEPGQPQPPLAVEDRLTVEPGRTATFDPLANDYIAPGDAVEVEILDGPDGARLDPETNLVTVPAPDSADAPPTVLVYRVTNGIDESRSTMTLTTAEDYDNPPIVYDAFGRADDSGSVVVDVLEGAYDPDGDVEDLEVVDVSGDPSARVVDGVQVRADRGEAPKVLPFQVRDADGATAAASVYIPPTGDGLPYVLPGSLIELDSGESTTGKVTDYIAAPDGGKVRLASGRRSYSASPTSLTVGPDGDNQFTLSAPAAFRGPGSVLVEVTTATDASGNEDATTTDGRRHRDPVDPGGGGRRRPVARVPLERHPDVVRPALRPRHRDVLQGLHRRPPRRRRPRLHRRVEPGRRRCRRREPRGLGRARHRLGRRHGGRRGRADGACRREQPAGGPLPAGPGPAAAAQPDPRRDHGGRAEPHLRHGRLPPGRRRQPRSHHRAGAEHRDARA